MTRDTGSAYRFRPGALDNIVKLRNLHDDEQLAAMLGFRKSQLEDFRYGRLLVDAPTALHIATIMGDKNYIAGWFESVGEEGEHG